MRSSPYPYIVNILFNIFTLSQEKSTESFRFCNNCAVLLVRSSHQQEKSIVLPFLWMFICWKISRIFLSSYLKRGTKRGQKCWGTSIKKNSPLFTYSGHLSPPPVYPHPLLPNHCCILNPLSFFNYKQHWFGGGGFFGVKTELYDKWKKLSIEARVLDKCVNHLSH